LTEEFLVFTKRPSNDLAAPMPDHSFPGPKPGGGRCLCAMRWKEAMDEGAAPPAILDARPTPALECVSLDELQAHPLAG